ncbi:MAG: DUF1772 domain-containing protein [Parvibaculum sp.]|nr:DUF1772 domain-containing protein [Parvibaculum sp.]
MAPLWLLIVTQISTIACALVSGVFLAFSEFIMRSLDKSERPAGIEVMQVINREVFRTFFMVCLIGISAMSLAFCAYAYVTLSGPLASWVMAGGAIYLLAVFGVTLAFNVPMNTHLDRLDYQSTDAKAYWEGIYFPRWTFWNHVRAIGAGASAICYLVAGLLLAQASTT